MDSSGQTESDKRKHKKVKLIYLRIFFFLILKVLICKAQREEKQKWSPIYWFTPQMAIILVFCVYFVLKAVVTEVERV